VGVFDYRSGNSQRILIAIVGMNPVTAKAAPNRILLSNVTTAATKT